MNYATVSRVLTLVGITINGVNFSYWTASWFSPLFDWFSLGFLFWTAMYLTFCLVLPVVGYGEIRVQSKSAAAAILIVSGIACPVVGSFGGLVGGVLICLAGGLAAAWQPLAKGGESATTS